MSLGIKMWIYLEANIKGMKNVNSIHCNALSAILENGDLKKTLDFGLRVQRIVINVHILRVGRWLWALKSNP